jgi:hypothetical protein
MRNGPRTFARIVIAKTLAGEQAAEFAAHRWGARSFVAEYLKSPVPAVTSAEDLSGPGRGDDEFWESVVAGSIFGRLEGLRQIAFNVRTLTMTAGARGYWVGERRPIPLSKPSLAGSSLARRKIGAIICMTRESIEAANPRAEARFEADIRAALVGALDQAFIDAGNAGVSSEMPAAVTAGLTPIASADPSTDVATLIAGFAGDLARAYFVTDPLTGAQLALARDVAGNFQFPDASARGGSLIGMPMLTSSSSPRDSTGGQLSLIDPTGIAGAADGVDIVSSQGASLVMSDDPEASGEAGEFVGLFSTDTIALKGVISANWERQRSGCVAVVTGCNYSVIAQS